MRNERSTARGEEEARKIESKKDAGLGEEVDYRGRIHVYLLT